MTDAAADAEYHVFNLTIHSQHLILLSLSSICDVFQGPEGPLGARGVRGLQVSDNTCVCKLVTLWCLEKSIFLPAYTALHTCIHLS